ncbi:hypothetical protein N7461_005006 [Penicillium sp. DV-2018c]|nr:hypothetical protein N7461_005006 [Penicillium sp. DV-2018c]
MRSLVFAFWALQCILVYTHPHAAETASSVSTSAASAEGLCFVLDFSTTVEPYGKRGYGQIIQARNTTAKAELSASTASATVETNPGASTSETSTMNSNINSASETTTAITSSSAVSTP